VIKIHYIVGYAFLFLSLLASIQSYALASYIVTSGILAYAMLKDQYETEMKTNAAEIDENGER